MKMLRRKNSAKLRKNKKDDGFTLIEVLIAIVILAIGLAGLLPMILVAVNNNTGTRQDSQAVMLAQMVAEQITSRPAGSNATFAVTDCRPTSLGGAQNFTVNSAAGGANVSTGGTFPAGTIDFSQAAGVVPVGYQMTFFACGDTGGVDASDNSQVPFDVRWNVSVTNGMKLVTVAARRSGAGTKMAGNGLQTLLFQQPVTLRTIVPQ
jgi:prepilin-type N-terminal cleavage/methylation domain-containing protein